MVTFHRPHADNTRVMVQMDFEPGGLHRDRRATSSASSSTRVKGDLERFKEFIEARGGETGAWRGEVQ